ncbi:hypothetical protein FMM05_20265 [Flavobacterium zepuense]|uniref:Uncharacterized protein n=1 Tax=Flavobacterium zepuense TaxID=2593302 RepID=A0A552UTG9_9FLAO|nr:hypothetical protein [Flavobacterium zepuense]TRW21487.1 hypothetical protein FMM05_20265 [Flavobacterium zepuense]
MPVFTKMSLKYTYKWPESGATEITSSDDDDMIDIKNGYHVLNFINVFFAQKGLTSIDTFYKLEYMLNERMPVTMETRKEMTTWVLTVWNRIFYT